MIVRWRVRVKQRQAMAISATIILPMSDTLPHAHRTHTSSAATQCIGCVSFLNALPLIDGLQACLPDDVALQYDVPSRLLEDLQQCDVDIALCPVIDFQRSEIPLSLVPVGCIGCDGPTLTVRLFSDIPIEQVDRVYVDSDSHTSVVLLQSLLHELHGIRPQLIEFNAREHVAHHRIEERPQSILLIGDKVVTDPMIALSYEHQMDLGEAWKALTGLPFVFAVWMSRQGADLGSIPDLLQQRRMRNATRIAQIADDNAVSRGWPQELARQYLSDMLCYEYGEAQRVAVQRFFEYADRLGLINTLRSLT